VNERDTIAKLEQLLSELMAQAEKDRRWIANLEKRNANQQRLLFELRAKLGLPIEEN
jgi:hypothetical protein